MRGLEENLEDVKENNFIEMIVAVSTMEPDYEHGNILSTTVERHKATSCNQLESSLVFLPVVPFRCNARHPDQERVNASSPLRYASPLRRVKYSKKICWPPKQHSSLLRPVFVCPKLYDEIVGTLMFSPQMEKCEAAKDSSDKPPHLLRI